MISYDAVRSSEGIHVILNLLQQHSHEIQYNAPPKGSCLNPVPIMGMYVAQLLPLLFLSQTGLRRLTLLFHPAPFGFIFP